MGMVMTFVPWLAFWILAGHGKLIPAIAVALAASVAAIVMEKMAGRSMKLLQIGTLAVFVLFALAALFVDRSLLGHWIRLLSNVALTLIVLVSILIGKPFTIQYARESVPKERWNSPAFLHANYVITWVWFAAFVANALASGLDHLIPSLDIVANYVIAIIPFIAASMFTSWYRKRGKGGAS